MDVTTLEEEVENYGRQIENMEQKYNAAIQQNTTEREEVEAAEKELKEIDRKIKAAIELSDPVKVFKSTYTYTSVTVIPNFIFLRHSLIHLY